jgi:hypothetical protein
MIVAPPQTRGLVGIEIRKITHRSSLIASSSCGAWRAGWQTEIKLLAFAFHTALLTITLDGPPALTVTRLREITQLLDFHSLHLIQSPFKARHLCLLAIGKMRIEVVEKPSLRHVALPKIRSLNTQCLPPSCYSPPL